MAVISFHPLHFLNLIFIRLKITNTRTSLYCTLKLVLLLNINISINNYVWILMKCFISPSYIPNTPKKKYFDRVFATPWRQSKLRQSTEGDLFISSLTDRNASLRVSIILVNNIIHATTRVKEWHELVFNANV